MATKNVTYDDIANLTHFSKTTISRFFNNPDSLTLKNQEVIRKALVELDYKENKLAKALAKGNSEFIGIILPNMYLHYYTEILNQILLSYEKYGYKFLVFLGDEDKRVEKAYINELMAFQIEGLIVLSHTIPSKELSEYNIPVVTIEREDEFVNSVNADNYQGAVEATRYLIEQDCDLLIHVNSVIPNNTPAKNRVNGFKDACKDHEIEHDLFIRDFGNNFEEANQKVKELFQELEENYSDRKIGLFFSNDTYANLFLNVVFRSYGKLPDKYKLIGFDNSPIAREGILQLSTIGQRIEEMASETMKILVGLMNERKKRQPKPQKQLIHKEIKPELIIRETT